MQRLIFHHSVKNESELCFTNTFMFLIAKDNSLSFLTGDASRESKNKIR